MMPTIQDLQLYLGIDYPDEMITRNLTRVLATAKGRVMGAIGLDAFDVLADDARLGELILIYAREAYDADTLTDKARAALKHLRDDLEPQLRLELQRRKTTEGVV